MKNLLKLAWVDLCVAPNHKGETPIGMDSYFDIERLDSPNLLDDYISDNSPDAICFDFDYPERASLGLMLDTKKKFTSVPMIMITLQHSEKLAVWAFRSKLADYLTKPVPQEEITRCHEMLAGMVRAKSTQNNRSINRHKSKLPREIALRSKTTRHSFHPAIYYVTENYDKKIQNDEAANLCAMSPFRFGREFKEAFGMSFRDYVVRYRLREACRLLRNPNISITEAAIAVGFSDPSYFGRLFKKHFGVCPTEKFGNPESNDNIFNSPTVQLQIPEALLKRSTI